MAYFIPSVKITFRFHLLKKTGIKRTEVGAFDGCVGGLGGCPFVRGAAGNVPTEDAVNLFESSVVPTGIDVSVLCEAVEFLEKALDRQLPGRMKRVLKQRHSDADGAGGEGNTDYR